jgi:hypothetical protein
MLIKDNNFNSRVLFATLKLNAIFSCLTGLVLILFNKTMAGFLGSMPPYVLLIIGLILTSFSIRLAYVSFKGEIRKMEALSIIVSDFLWVVGSISLLLIAPYFFTEAGKWIVVATAIPVISFAEFQLYGLWKVVRA